ncbi:Coiled-coil domain-containing protein 60 [Acropora cervicornis]|uniref:Coiled-coil domain-containing protein 60 n=1 Tax=Acropora cervicornis TaxID=6130 RepID=A0AAD9V3K5_ACRCE|nr:Coiled-coil domain-containing protein 60 [Acropora cervicornis]
MPDTENPRSYIRPVPLPIPSHQGLKITTRNAKIYTCEVPARKEVARENHERRRHQINKCGYRSVNYKPYQPVGEVYLDDKKLILSALGQEQTAQVEQIQDESSSSSGESESEDEESMRQSKPKVINDIKAQVKKGRKMIHAVRLGFGLYTLIHNEQNKKQAEAEKERKQKEEAARNQMKPASTDTKSPTMDNESSTEQPERDGLMQSVPSSPTTSPKRFLQPPTSAPISTASKSNRKSHKLRSPRPYSPVYSNINYDHLCALNWILEGMSQDQQPPVMPPITSCWKLKDLNEEPKTIRKRVEKDKATEKDWATFKQNPTRFTQRGPRRGTRRISIHPNFIQRLSTANNSGVPNLAAGPNNALRIPVEARPRSGQSLIAETVMSSRTELQTEHTSDLRAIPESSGSEDRVSAGGPTVTFVNPKIRAVSAPPGSINEETTATPGELQAAISSTPENGALPNGIPGGTEKKGPPKLQKQKSFTVTTVYTPPSNASKAIQKIRAKTRAAKAFKNTLSQKQVEKLTSKPEEQQTASDSRAPSTPKVPIDSKIKFNEVAEEQALILHDNLEVRDR